LLYILKEERFINSKYLFYLLGVIVVPIRVVVVFTVIRVKIVVFIVIRVKANIPIFTISLGKLIIRS
jgi:hypothetical protein